MLLFRCICLSIYRFYMVNCFHLILNHSHIYSSGSEMNCFSQTVDIVYGIHVDTIYVK